MKIKVSQWGNSLAVRLPQSAVSHFHLKAGDLLTINTSNNELVLKKTKTLESLLSTIEADMIHHETDWGASIGKESMG